MIRWMLSLLLCAGFALAGAPADVTVQGLYEGSCKSDNGVECKLEVRVVAQGKGEFKVFIRETLPDGKLVKVDGEAKTDGDAVAFKAKVGDTAWSGTYADGGFTGTCPTGCKLAIKRVQRQSPTLGKKPPEGAIVLLDGKNFVQLNKRKNKDGTENPWPQAAEDGSMQVAKGGMSSKQGLDGSFDYHVEFINPFMPDKHSQGRGNSGVFLPNGDEIQFSTPSAMPRMWAAAVAASTSTKTPTPSTSSPSLRFRRSNGRPTTSNTASRSRTARSWPSRA